MVASLHHHTRAALLLAGVASLGLAWRRRASHQPLLPRAAQLCVWWLRQRLLRLWLVTHDLCPLESVRLVGGVDISFVKESTTDACAALVVVDPATQEVVYEACRRIVLTAPYIPGYLAFREVRFLLQLVEELRSTRPELMPQVILSDGNGILHPNHFGVACHLGVLAGIPTVGVGKTLHHVDGLSKESVRRLSESLIKAGDHALLVGQSGTVWGAVLRTTSPAEGNFKPVIISVGHGISLNSAISLVWRTCKHRIPEPVRQADLRSREWLRRNGSQCSA
ncbi:hypothetical protein AB1Y20_018109 [Prymnesium parvum]|uniref:Endonuclease V n=1 Tax=Prymnesium parvum TaxID=97485 RepID=A0AB34JMK0_PRYPA